MNAETKDKLYNYALSTTGVAVAVAFFYLYPESWPKRIYGVVVLVLSTWLLISTYTGKG